MPVTKKIGTILTLAGPSYLAGLAEHQRPDAIKTLNTIHAAAAAFNAEMDASSVDPALTPQGRASKSSASKTSALTLLESVDKIINALNERVTAGEAALRAKVAHVAPKDSAHEQQLREVRDQLRGLTSEQRLQVYRSTSDPLVLQACETAPATLNTQRNRLEPFVDPAEVATAVMARAAAADPANATTLKELRSLAEMYQLAVGSVRREINDVVPER